MAFYPDTIVAQCRLTARVLFAITISLALINPQEPVNNNCMIINNNSMIVNNNSSENTQETARFSFATLSNEELLNELHRSERKLVSLVQKSFLTLELFEMETTAIRLRLVLEQQNTRSSDHVSSTELAQLLEEAVEVNKNMRLRLWQLERRCARQTRRRGCAHDVMPLLPTVPIIPELLSSSARNSSSSQPPLLVSSSARASTVLSQASVLADEVPS